MSERAERNETLSPDPNAPKREIVLPAPTAAPLVLASGIALMLGGIVTNLAFSIVGVVIAVWGIGSWIRQLVVPGGTEVLQVTGEGPARIKRAAGTVQSLREGWLHRGQVPQQYHPYSTGAWGGLVGGGLMAITAMAYGWFSGHGVWYPVNLLAGMVFPSFATFSHEDLGRFHLLGFLVACAIHVVASVALGLLYGVLLPAIPGPKLLSGGVIAPLLWTGAIYSFMGVLNPPLQEIISQRSVLPWFVLSQFAYGIGVDVYVMRTGKIKS